MTGVSLDHTHHNAAGMTSENYAIVAPDDGTKPLTKPMLEYC